MASDLKNVLLTIPFLILLVVMFLWLLRAMIPGKRAVERRDKFDRAGYETVRTTRAKEYSVIGISALVILSCLGLMGFLTYQIFREGIAGDFGAAKSLDIVLIFIPAIVLLSFVVVASRRYVKHQEKTLAEFKDFKAKRQQALSNYNEKRRGRGGENLEDLTLTVRQKVDRSENKPRERNKKRKRIAGS
jgi:hypothetical protein